MGHRVNHPRFPLGIPPGKMILHQVEKLVNGWKTIALGNLFQNLPLETPRQKKLAQHFLRGGKLQNLSRSRADFQTGAALTGYSTG